MRPRELCLLLAAVLFALLLVLPAIAGSETTPTVEAVNEGGGYYGERHSWSPAQVTVGANGAVTFQNPSAVAHGVEWVGGPAKPSCSSGVPVGNSPAASGTKWSGTCAFTQPGTYTFYCTVHGASMSGTITVSAGGTPTTTTPTQPPPTPTTPTPTPPSPETPGVPPGGPAYTALELAAGRQGESVRGSVEVSQAGVGGRLEVNLLARRALLARAGSTEVRVGRLMHAALGAGKISFIVPLDAKARRVLRARRRLAVTVKVLLTPGHGSATTTTRGVTLRS